MREQKEIGQTIVASLIVSGRPAIIRPPGRNGTTIPSNPTNKDPGVPTSANFGTHDYIAKICRRAIDRNEAIPGQFRAVELIVHLRAHLLGGIGMWPRTPKGSRHSSPNEVRTVSIVIRDVDCRFPVLSSVATNA